MFRKLLLSSLLVNCFFATHLWAQALPQKGAPYIQTLQTPTRGITDVNHKILQNKTGLLFIQNSNGIHIYNGSAFSFISTPSTPDITLVKDTLFVSVRDKVYKLREDPSGGLTLHAVAQASSQAHISSIMTINNRLWALINEHIYQLQDSIFQRLTISDEPVKMAFGHKNKAWFVTPKKILTTNTHTTHIHPLPSNENGVLKIINWGKKGFVYNNQQGFSWVDGSPIQPWPATLQNFLKKHSFTDMAALNDSLLAVGTKSGGILIVNRQGVLKKYLGVNAGLLDLHVRGLFVDSHNNLWASHKRGLSRIEYPSSLNYFTHKHGLRGAINAAILHQGHLYLGTSQGIFTHDKPENSENNCFTCPLFIPIGSSETNVYTFFKMQQKLYASTSEGIFLIDNKKAQLYYNRDKDLTTVVLKSKHKENTLYIGRKDGLHAIHYNDGLFLIKPKILGITGEVNSLQEDGAGNLFASTRQGYIYRIPAYEQYDASLKFHSYSFKDLHPAIHWGELFALGKTVALTTNKGLFTYNPVEKEFTQKSLQGMPENYWAFPIATDNRGNAWINIQSGNPRDDYHALYYLPNATDNYAKTVPLYRKQSLDITSILPQNNGTIWFGGFEQLIHFAPEKQKTSRKPFHTLITQMTVAQDSSLLKERLYDAPIHIDKKLEANKNNPVFVYSSTSYESEDRTLYQSRLIGLDTLWSSWNQNTTRSFTNLRKGTYVFEVRSKDIYGYTTTPARVHFSVNPPLRRTMGAYLLYIITLALFIYLILTWRAYLYAKERLKLESIISQRTEELILQKEKADNLLERVLPKSTANDLKSGKKARPAHYNLATVLFSDIQGFTKISEQLDSEHLIDELDRFFLTFDNVVEKYNIEKIKTIGDAYMCAGGIPQKNRTNPVEVVLAAMEMQYYMKVLKHQKDQGADKIWDLRIGIDTGPVVAAVLGRSRISFDIWGSTVNTASRMEASSEPGKINITENTYMLIKDFFICTYRGKMPVKYKGEIDMYFVEGFRPKLATDLKGMQPNQRFFTQLQSLRWNDLEEFVLEKLEKGLPNKLYYHNVKHTIDVVTQVELIGRSEGVSEEDILLLKTAGLFHDMGHLVNYDTHEEEGIKLAERILPEFKYTERQIQSVIQLILATEMPPRPNNLLEEIICDADLDYLGRADFVPVAYTLYKELREHNKVTSLKDWNNRQVAFIKKHHYFTQTAKKLREVNKMNQLEKLEEELAKMELDDNEALRS